MTIIKVVRFSKIDDDEFIYFTDRKHRTSAFSPCLSVRKIRKYIDMSIPVFHAEPFYPSCESTVYEWLFTISTKDYEDLCARKD